MLSFHPPGLLSLGPGIAPVLQAALVGRLTPGGVGRWIYNTADNINVNTAGNIICYTQPADTKKLVTSLVGTKLLGCKMANRSNDAFEWMMAGMSASEARRVGVYVCYLDDSYSDKGNAICLSGYYSTLDKWVELERAATAVFEAFGVKTLHTKKLHHRRGAFAGWDERRAVNFVYELFRIVSPFIVEGISTCVDKEWYRNVKRSKPREMANFSPLGLAFSATINAILFNGIEAEKVADSGLKFVIESGNKNNGNLEKYLHWLRKSSVYGEFLGSITFSAKESCKAIQLADFMAFYSRRAFEKRGHSGGRFEDPDLLFQIAGSFVWHRYNHLWGGASLNEEISTDKIGSSSIITYRGDGGGTG